MYKIESKHLLSKRDKAADQRLRRTYGIGLEDYDRMLKEQNGGCWICHKPPKEGRRLHVDHDHKIARLKIKSAKDKYGIWKARAGVPVLIGFMEVIGISSERKDAISKVRTELKKMSVRGLLDWKCNSALQKFRDDPELMESAARYIREYQKRING